MNDLGGGERPRLVSADTTGPVSGGSACWRQDDTLENYRSLCFELFAEGFQICSIIVV